METPLYPPRQRPSLGPTPDEQAQLVAELAIVSLARSLSTNQDVVDILDHLYQDAGPGHSRLRRMATMTDGLWADLARPAYTRDGPAPLGT